MQLQTEKAIATTVDAKLKSAEEREVAELEAAIKSVQASARPPMRIVKCAAERDACVSCYKENGATDALKCAQYVDALAECAALDTRGLIFKGTALQ